MKEFKLNDGNIIPAIGFGVFRIDPNGPTYEATFAALGVGTATSTRRPPTTTRRTWAAPCATPASRAKRSL